jgi:preprotein translocase subunit YajC
MKEPNLPVWMSWIMVIGLMLFIYFMVKFEVDTKRKERQEDLRKSFSRLSDSEEVQEAYNELNHQK